jgi:hypothetical protein
MTDAEFETAREVAHFDVVEGYIRNLFAEQPHLTDEQQTLIAGNLRAFYVHLHPWPLPEADKALIDAAFEQHVAT